MLRAGLRRATRVATISLLGALCFGGAASAAGDRSDRSADPMPPRIVAQSALAPRGLRQGSRSAGMAVGGANRLAAMFAAWHAGVAARVRRTARLPAIARLNALLSAFPVGGQWAARPVGAAVAAIIGF